MRIGMAQLDSRIGDLEVNARRIVDAWRCAREAGADLVVTPELALCGYPPRDLLLDPAFVEDALAATRDLATATADGPPLLVGTVARARTPGPHHPGLYGGVALLSGGAVVDFRAKRLLPAGDVFHEPRWFVPGPPAPPLVLGGRQVGIVICEDLWDEPWDEHPALDLAGAGAQLLVSVSASPYREDVLSRRLRVAARPGLPIVYVNAVGAQDELVFDGGSFVLDSQGRLRAMLPRFEEAVEVVDLDCLPAPRPLPASSPQELFAALVSGVRGFARKNGLRRAWLGLSGGIDSAVVACVAREALGAAAVTAVALPTRHTDPRSTESARDLAASLAIGFEVVDIEALHAAARETLAPLLAPEAADGTTAENIQCRLRALVLMAHVNRHGGFLLNTSNKTELALGYGTLYGDLAGTISVLGDVTKTRVYALGRWLHERRGLIPDFILERAPTAELRPDQVDPFDYARVSPIVEALVQGRPLPPDADAALVEQCRRLVDSAEHKRWQAGIVLKVTERAFGTGRLMPVTRRWRARPGNGNEQSASKPPSRARASSRTREGASDNDRSAQAVAAG